MPMMVAVLRYYSQGLRHLLRPCLITYKELARAEHKTTWAVTVLGFKVSHTTPGTVPVQV